MTGETGILAYGSLIDDPGDELRAATDKLLMKGIITPFNVEFARSSRSRAGAPTLIPVEDCGAPVSARLLVLKCGTSVQDARTMLWRRESRRASGEYDETAQVGPDRVKIDLVYNFHGIAVVLYARIAPNIQPLTAQTLAKLAIDSVRSCAVPEGRDGISYLIAAVKNGIRTPLSAQYEQQVKDQTGTTSLAGGLARVQKLKRLPH